MEIIYILKLLATILFGAFLGAFSMIPVGAVQLQVIKKSIRGHLRAAIMTALGSATSDFIYGLLILYGFGGFMMKKNFQIIVYSAGIIVLTIALLRIYPERRHLVHQDQTPKYHGRISFLSGFSLAITNPGMIIWWLLGYHLFLNLGLFEDPSVAIRALFLVSVCAGLGGYLIIVSLIVYRIKKSFSEKILYRANMFIIFLMSFLILYFIFKLVCVFLNLPFGLGRGL
jgi:threonine/homoserine/homoserine lactone efflux protein